MNVGATGLVARYHSYLMYYSVISHAEKVCFQKLSGRIGSDDALQNSSSIYLQGVKILLFDWAYLSKEALNFNAVCKIKMLHPQLCICTCTFRKV